MYSVVSSLLSLIISGVGTVSREAERTPNEFSKTLKGGSGTVGMQAPAPASVQDLLQAVQDGDIDRVRELLGIIDVNADDGGFTALFVGATTGNLAIVKMLMDQIFYDAQRHLPPSTALTS